MSTMKSGSCISCKAIELLYYIQIREIANDFKIVFSLVWVHCTDSIAFEVQKSIQSELYFSRLISA